MNMSAYNKTKEKLEKFHAEAQEIVERTVIRGKIKKVTAVDWVSGTHAAVFFEDLDGTRDMTIIPVRELEFSEV